MPKADAFLIVYPVLHEVALTAYLIDETLSDTAWEIRQDGPRLRIARGDTVAKVKDMYRPYIERLTHGLQDDRLKSLEVDFYGPLSEGLHLLVSAVDWHDLVSAEEHLSIGLKKVDSFIEDQMVDAFGDWGAHFFRVAVELGTDGDWDILPKKGIDWLIYGFDNIADLKVLTKPSRLILNRATFSVCWGNREPCVLGNGKGYRFLEALNQSPNEFVNFWELAKRMGGDDGDVSALPATKCRLLKNLREGGLVSLARCIKAQTNHYGLILR